MEVVIDSNFLRSPELRAFLALSPRNKAVLTDYCAMEAYKNADPIAAMQAQMAILSEFPSQVVVLKGTATVAGLRGRRAGLRRRMIDLDQTTNFPTFCRYLRQASTDSGVRNTINQYAVTARSNIEAVTADMTGLMSGIVDMAKVYDANELRILRGGGAFTELMIEKFVHVTMLLAAQLHHKQPNSLRMPSAQELPNTFLFRAAVCMQLVVLRWAETGRSTARPEKLRNDVIDLNFATYATFFDDFFTDDKRALDLYAEAKVTLELLIPAGLMP
jgi:hypothetical protein